jgi:hypothetical protein
VAHLEATLGQASLDAITWSAPSCFASQYERLTST